MIFGFFFFLGGGGGGGGVKRAKNDLTLPISECFALYLRNCRSYLQDFDNGIYMCFSLYFFKKMQHCKYENYFVFHCATSTVFLNNNLFFKFIN